MNKKSHFLSLLTTIFLFSIAVPAAAQTTSPTPTPQAVIAAFKKSGLEAESPKVMSVKDYGSGPQVCTGVRFLVPSLGLGAGGRAFVCKSTAERDSLAGFYNALSKQSERLFSWVFVSGPVLVQINGSLPKAKALQYEKAIAPFGQTQTTPRATLTPVVNAQAKATQAYTVAILVKASVTLIEELALASNARKIDGPNNIGAGIMISLIYSATKDALQTAPPSVEFQPAWTQGGVTTKKLDAVLQAWRDQKIDATEVLKRLPAIQTDADLTIKYAQDIAVAKFKLNRADLQKEYEAQIATLRSGFQDAFK